ncbi:MAG TPA: hypothetical protein VHB27_14390 [Rhodopila sp.]|uniref:hypothetical protein n=1 Tax=Rhodopila sp. TaxID=2480087 RepID=UPI002CDF25F9|nr:hypothetical protein [Rhodopila sp.]HVY16411.1 hypothetical protein [Rhodopila sp.]
MTPRRTLLLMLATACASFALVWAWVIAMPMTFMESEYGAWHAKEVMLNRCDLGDTIILGDSRAAADILPARLDGRATNLAIGGGEAVEALALLRRALACPHPPRRVVLSFDAGHFSRPDLFWERSVRFGFLSAADIAELRRVSEATADPSVYQERRTDILPDRLRDWLRLAHFPTYDFPSLLHGGVFLRVLHNRHMLAATLASRGQYSFGTAPGSDEVAVEGHLATFRPLPVLDHYFNEIVSMLDRRGIETVFLPMPVNDATYRRITPALLTGFTAYLHAYAARYRWFRVAGEIIPHRPDSAFGDEFCHMNPPAADRYSQELAQRLQAAPPSTQNDAQNGWLSGTGRAASANVVPISKRGS